MRLSAVFAAFVQMIAAVGAELAGKVADAVFGAIGAPKAGTERTLKGVTYVDRPVDHGRMSSDLREILRAEGLHADANEVVRAIAEEGKKRGPVWENQCLAATLEDHLVAPLRKVAEAGGVAPAPAKKGKKAA